MDAGKYIRGGIMAVHVIDQVSENIGVGQCFRAKIQSIGIDIGNNQKQSHPDGQIRSKFVIFLTAVVKKRKIKNGQYNISKPQEIGNNEIFTKRNHIIQRRMYHVVVADHRTFQQSKTNHIKDSVQRNQKSVPIFLEEKFQEITPFHYYVISNNA